MRLESRRQWLERCALGFGGCALQWMLARDSQAHEPKTVGFHFPPRAKSVIMLMQNGGPSQMDLFDPKPNLSRRGGQVHTEKVEMFQPGSEQNKLLSSPWSFSRHGECGMDISNAVPHLATVADELCMVRSMQSEHNNHTEALVMVTSGKIFPGRPTLGAWLSYGLGTENDNLPAYVVLRDPKGFPSTGSTLWQNGWLPAIHRGTQLNAEGTPFLNLSPAQKLLDGARDDDRRFLRQLNERHRKRYPHESALDARIRNYELAASLQVSAADALDLSGESAATQQMYGLDQPATSGYGRRMLMARRLVEAGVRFVQVFPAQGAPWDSHQDVNGEIRKVAAEVDQPSAALIRDLRQRGLLDETIVIWTGEFGRLPISQNGKGRDHNRNAFTLLAAGGGFKAGHIHGTTDDVGYRAVEHPVSIPDLFATVLHQMGLDHDALTYNHHGRDETLTDSPVSSASVVAELLARPAG